METNKHKKTEGDKEKTKKNRRKRANKEKEEAILLAVCFFVYSARSSTLYKDITFLRNVCMRQHGATFI